MEEARKPMGKLKIDHIREMCEMDRIKIFGQISLVKCQLKMM